MGTALIVLFGILLPTVTLAIELGSGMCAQMFFDPLATPLHIVLVALVPVANLAVLLDTGKNFVTWRRTLLWVNAVAIGVALFYAIAFLPISPFAVVGILFVGLGLLPLSPLLSLFAALALRWRLVELPPVAPSVEAPSPPRPSSSLSFWLGGLLGVCLVLAAESWLLMAHVGLDLALSDEPTERTYGLKLLRNVGSRNELLQMCYDEWRPHSMSGWVYQMLLLREHVSRQDAQQVYYAVTGEPFNARPAPRLFRGRLIDDFDFDPDVGGEAVAGRRRGLSLESSRIDAVVHPDAVAAHLEWTMIFQNRHIEQREARAQILLPPGGVVSRVTLWVNGEPREAAFGSSGQVREAYRKVAVVQRRDPLLVTWSAPDRVMIQCFPVPANGQMKILLGITAPLVLGVPETGVLRLPAIAERNFSIKDPEIHAVWARSDRAFRQTPDGLGETASTEAGTTEIQGTLSDEALSSAGATLRVERSPSATEAWTADPKDPKFHIVQKVVARPSKARQRIALVVDGSVGMAGHFDALGRAIAAVPPQTDLCLLVAGDEVIDLSDEVSDRAGLTADKVTWRLRQVAGVGGCDNVAGLNRAFQHLPASGDTAVVWVHAPQPVLLRPATTLAQRLERGRRVELIDFAVTPGPNRVIDELKGAGPIRCAPRTGTVDDDLTALLAQLTGQATRYELQRSRVEGNPPATPKSTSKLALLWARDEVARMFAGGRAADLAEAGQLGVKYLLVTPLTGAVVLETKQQYDESNLKPADPEQVPGVPEPGTLLLLLAALPALGWFIWRRRRAL